MAERRCETCDHWRQITGAPWYGECKVPLPWWHDTLPNAAHVTHRHEGRDCAAWKAREDV